MHTKQYKILFLYSELASYNIACFNELVTQFNVELYVVKMPLHANAPFALTNFDERIKFYDINSISDAELNGLLHKINPHLIYCSGWINKKYISVLKQNKNKFTTVLGIDNQWQGTLKQHLGAIYAHINYKPLFNYAFVAGEKQKLFAVKMGFESQNIYKGVYTADTKQFEQVNAKLDSKIFIYVGRYVKEKGIEQLCNAFINISSNEGRSWQLWCIGKGDYVIPKHNQIKDLGFKQPIELVQIIKDASVFVLPSTFEPWGVVIHEFASSGFPIISSSKVGANELFVKPSKNGYVFEAGNQLDLENQLKKICQLDNNKMQEMSNFSKSLSKQLSPNLWAQTLIKLIK